MEIAAAAAHRVAALGLAHVLEGGHQPHHLHVSMSAALFVAPARSEWSYFGRPLLAPLQTELSTCTSDGSHPLSLTSSEATLERMADVAAVLFCAIVLATAECVMAALAFS